MDRRVKEVTRRDVRCRVQDSEDVFRWPRRGWKVGDHPLVVAVVGAETLSSAGHDVEYEEFTAGYNWVAPRVYFAWNILRNESSTDLEEVLTSVADQVLMSRSQHCDFRVC